MNIETMFCNLELHMVGGETKGHFEFKGDAIYSAAVLGVILKELHVHEYDEETAIAILSSALDMAEQIAADEAAENKGVLN